jgi:hypothetical protein
MATDTMANTRLERAYVESKVIRSGLDHLAERLNDDQRLRGDLQACTDRFDAYMRELNEACDRAAGSKKRK